MKKKNWVFQIAKFSAAFAFLLGMSSVNATCAGWIHQPKVPESINRFKK